VSEAVPGAASAQLPPALAAGAPPAADLQAGLCLDCGAPLSGRYCATCGQKDQPLKRGLRDLALEFFQHPLVDSRLWKSLVPLLFRPGVLTVEYLAGRRTRYVRPLKLYLTISVIFFAVLALRVTPDKWVTVDSPTDGTTPKRAITVKPDAGRHFPIRWLDERFRRNTAALDAPDGGAVRTAIATRVAGSFPKMVFVLLPLSAFLFKLFWWRRYYVEHLIFSLHLHSYGFAMGLLRLIEWPGLTGVIVLWSCVYVVLAFKRVYAEVWWKTLLKLFGVIFSYSLLLAAALLVTAFAALLA
jgi:Protein of unknown function (DUF3667)